MVTAPAIVIVIVIVWALALLMGDCTP